MGRRDRPESGPAEGGELDDLFGDDNFREYDDSINPFTAPPSLHTAPTARIDPAPGSAALTNRMDASPFVGEPRSPIHDRLSETVAMPVAAEPHVPVPIAPTFEQLTTPSMPPPEAAPASGGSPSGFSPGLLLKRLGVPRRAVIGVAAGAALVLVLTGLFLVGKAIGGGADSAATAEGGAEASVTTLEPGTYPWAALQGGECLDSFDSVWAEEFTVVECEAPHGGQFMHRGEVGPEVTVYLDAEGWQGLIPSLCDASTLLDLDAGAELTDLQWQISYAGDATEWANGDRSYGCFINRASGEPLTGSLLATS